MPEAQTETTSVADPAALANGADDAADEIVVGETQTAQAATDPAVETYARSQGWVPKEEYRGDAARWVDAKTFADRAEQINPIIKSRLRETEAKLVKTQEDLERVRNESKDFAEFVRRQEKASYDAQLAVLRKARADAISEGDGEKVDEIEGKMRTLSPPKDLAKDEPKPAAELQVSAELRAAAESFAEKYTWLDASKATYDAPKARLLKATAAALREDRPELINTPGFFTALERQLQTDYPQVFAAAKPKTIVDSGGSPGGAASNGKKSFRDMPKDAQDTAKRWVENKWIPNVELYAKEYFASLGEQQ